MKKINDYLLGISLGILLLILMETLITFGAAFQFEKYNVFGWFVQVLLLVFAVTISIKVTNDNYEN